MSHSTSKNFPRHDHLPFHIHSIPSSGTATPINTLPTSFLSSQPHSTPYNTNSNNNAYTPVEAFEIVSRMGVKKAHMRIDKMFLSAVSAGMILAFACATLISTNTAPWYQENAPGLLKTVAALVFPYGLVIVQMTASDLCTGSFMYTTVSVVHGRISAWRMLRHWAVTFVGNLAGSLFVCCVVVGCKFAVREASTYADFAVY
jgi:formate/nitrite transporter FocA (FNT family)